ncbi:class I SAM-dependent methyltransferase [Chloroflexota bacterium]
MQSEKQSSEKMLEIANTYFNLQANWAITKHMGGLKATEKLFELCHIDGKRYVLVVGCGVGVTPCYLAGKYGSRVIGVDLSEEMVERSRKRAKNKGMAGIAEFQVADAQDLPFEDNTFDAVICESVNAFITEKTKAMTEYARVTKPGGYVGFNEVTWLEMPPADLVEYLYRIMGAEFLTGNDWKRLLDDSELSEITALIYKTNVLSQWINEVRQIEFYDFLRAWSTFIYLFFTNKACRRFAKEALSFPRSILSLFRYFGYGIYVGREPDI